MYLKELKIWNFRKYGTSNNSDIKDDNYKLKVSFNEGLNVLIGENDSGKTAVIDSIRYLLDTNSQERTWITDEDFHLGTSEMRIDACFAFSKGEDAIETCSGFPEHLSTIDGSPFLFITLKATLTDRRLRGTQYIDKSVKSGVNGSGGNIENEIREFLRTTYLKPLRDAIQELSAGRCSRLSQILAGHSKIKEKGGELIDIVVKANQDIEKHVIISETENEINEKYFDELKFEGDDISTKIKMSDAIESSKLNDSQKYFILKRILEKLNLNLADKDIDVLTKHGLGYNNLMFMATEMLLIQQEKNENLPLLLIEEPEAHIHPQMQMQLLEFLKTQKEVQTILTTHSPILASKVPLDSMLLLAQDKIFSLDRKFTTLGADKTEDNYHYLEMFLDSTKANLFFARGVIIVEGDAENILIPILAKLLGISLEKNGISVVNVGHAGLFRFSKIFQRINYEQEGIIPIKVACLSDRDLRPVVVEYAADGDKSELKYVRKTSENEKSFFSFYDESKEEKKLGKYIDGKKENDGQNVKTFVSPCWTLEFDLAKFGLAEEMANSVYKLQTKITEITGLTSEDEKAARIYKPLHNKSASKTETAFRLSQILTEKYWDDVTNAPKDTEGLKQKLPEYILKMFKHVTDGKFKYEEQQDV